MDFTGKQILITGATGRQGGAIARALAAAGWPLRALVRNPSSPQAVGLGKLGIELMKGNLDDRPSLDRALAGAYGVYSMQTFGKGIDEVAQGKRVADAAKAAGVSHLVYSSGASVERVQQFPHFRSKWAIEQHIQQLGLPATILRPTFFMEMLWDKKVAPPIGWGVLREILGSKTRLQMIACTDIGAFAAKAFAEPKSFIGRAIELAGDELNHHEAVESYRAVFGKRPFHFPFAMTVIRALSKDVHEMFEWFRQPRYVADIAGLRREHPKLRTLRSFFEEQRAAS